ncbi:MAG: rhamnulokinase family protein [Acidobacteriota bacterium]
MTEGLYIAIDLGAGSGRVFLADFAPDAFRLDEIRRFHYPPRHLDGHLRWNFAHIFSEIKIGLQEASQRAQTLRRPVESIGVDSWAVDYGLIDDAGNLIEDPVGYRDGRTEGMMSRVFERMPQEEIFARTGIQFLNLNTLYQLFAHTQSGISDRAQHLLLIPDLINFLLTGKIINEYTNATTTQLVNAETGKWDEEIIDRLNLPEQLFNEIIPAGKVIAPLPADIAKETNLEGVKVVAPATHDTGSAVAGTPLENDWAYISSGTWSLVGVELAKPLINDEIVRHNFTNEGGAFDTTRFLKNVMGLWILESCRQEWLSRGLDVEYANLLAQVESLDEDCGLIFPDDARFFNPPSMLEAIGDQLQETGQAIPDEPHKIAKVILDSLAFRYASVLRTIELLTKKKITGVHVIGGGSLNDYLNQMTADTTGLPVLAGPVEATVIGNVLVQAIAAGRFVSLADGRKYLTDKLQLKKFLPRRLPDLSERTKKYATIEARYIQQ